MAICLLLLLAAQRAEAILHCDRTNTADIGQSCPSGTSWFDAVPPPCCEVIPCYMLCAEGGSSGSSGSSGGGDTGGIGVIGGGVGGISICDLDSTCYPTCEDNAQWLILSPRKPGTITFDCDARSVDTGLLQGLTPHSVLTLAPAYDSCCSRSILRRGYLLVLRRKSHSV